MVYATGGFAYGDVRTRFSQRLRQRTPPRRHDPGGVPVDWQSRNATLTGWVVGGGVEVALSSSWSAKAEYQYIDLGSTNLTAPTTLSYTPAC